MIKNLKICKIYHKKKFKNKYVHDKIHFSKIQKKTEIHKN